jgi:hypothetical protein
MYQPIGPNRLNVSFICPYFLHPNLIFINSYIHLPFLSHPSFSTFYIFHLGKMGNMVRFVNFLNVYTKRNEGDVEYSRVASFG